MQEIGVVESINEKNGTAKVVFDRKSACENCKMCLTAGGEKMKVYVEVKNTLGAKVGDQVGVTMNDAFVLKAAFIIYLIPVILVGAGLAIFRKFSDLILLVVVAVGLLLGAAVGIVVDRIIRKKGRFAPTMSALYPKETSDPSNEGADIVDPSQTESSPKESVEPADSGVDRADQ